jgi:hypothetical protein
VTIALISANSIFLIFYLFLDAKVRNFFESTKLFRKYFWDINVFKQKKVGRL